MICIRDLAMMSSEGMCDGDVNLKVATICI